MKGQQESLTTVVIKQAGPAVPVSSNTDGSRLESWATPRTGAIDSTRPNNKGGVPLADQVVRSQWQTATVSTGANRQKDGSMTDKLDQQVKNWSTPKCQDSHNPGLTNCKPGSTLHLGTQAGRLEQVKQSWPTPASAGVTGGPTGLAGGSGNREKLASMLPDAEARAMGCGKLNPRWVETLMGLPVGWTMPSCASPVTIERMSSDSSVTVLSQQQQNEPSKA